MNLPDWHARFKLQALWTRQVRSFLLAKAAARPARLLDVGCGTGALFSDHLRSGFSVTGIDLDLKRLRFARTSHQDLPMLLSGADAHAIPLANDAYDVSACHFLLLWLEDAAQVVREMARVTKPGGLVALFAEPDYLSRVAYPDSLADLGKMQNESLALQGASLDAGRKLAAHLQSAGLRDVGVGVISSLREGVNKELVEAEWEMLKADLSILPKVDLQQAQRDLFQAWESGSATWFVPTFYAWGFK